MQQTLTYRNDPDDAGDIEAIRITVKTMLVKGIGDHARLTEQVQRQWNLDQGINTTDATTPPQTTPMDAQVLLFYYKRWVTCFVATTRVEIVKRTKKLNLDEDNPEGWPWEASSLVALGLDKPEGILDIKGDLLDAWEQAAMTVNPGVFGGKTLTSAAKKKTGLLTVM